MRRRLLPSTLFVVPVLLASWLLVRTAPAQPPGELRAPAGNRPAQINPGGETILPNGRLITPLGRWVKVAPHPYGLAISPDGSTLVTSNSGHKPFSFSIVTELDAETPSVAQVPPGFENVNADPESVYLGVAIAPDNRTLYLSEGDNGHAGVFDLATRRRRGSVSLDGSFHGKNYRNSLTGDLRLSADGAALYVLDIAHFRLVDIDTRTLKIVASLPVGRLPFALALAPDGRTLFVSNVGVFHYQLVPGLDMNRLADTGLSFPPFGFPSQQAQAGTVAGGRRIAGLGNPNTLESNTVWGIDVSHPSDPHVMAKIPTGIPMGPKSFGGASPGAVIAGRDRVYVSNTNQDSVAIIDPAAGKVVNTVELEPAASVRGLGGVLPFGLALSPDGSRLYVACAGINAVAVLDTRQAKVLGYMPAGWFPARLVLSPDGKTLYVSNAKGFGAGPNGGPNFHMGPEGDYVGDITKGVITIVPVPADDQLADLTSRVLRNNGFVPVETEARPAGFPIPPAGQASAKIHHVVFIVKENRTFDEVFGDLGPVHGEEPNAEPSLARWGESATVREEGEATLEHVSVTPNLHALARQFAISDNFYVDSDVSVDGHHWLQGSYPNELAETMWPANYGDHLRFVADNDAPGRIVIGGTTPKPEEYMEGGMLWTHLARHHVTFRNFGEGYDLPGDNDGFSLPSGVSLVTNAPMLKVLFDHTSRTYPMFNTSIPDQYRFNQFKREFEARYIRGKRPLPQFLYIWLSNDHTDKPRPGDGYAYRASYVADNDLALGKLLDYFSHGPFWKDMAVFVTEDDAQDGRDHVEAHRSVLLVLSPYARRGVSHVHTSMASILKTFDLIFGLPPLNQYDAATNDLADMFTDQPDFTPYSVRPCDTRIFNPARITMPGTGRRAGRLPPSAPLDDPATIRRQMREDAAGRE